MVVAVARLYGAVKPLCAIPVMRAGLEITGRGYLAHAAYLIQYSHGVVRLYGYMFSSRWSIWSICQCPSGLQWGDFPAPSEATWKDMTAWNRRIMTAWNRCIASHNKAQHTANHVHNGGCIVLDRVFDIYSRNVSTMHFSLVYLRHNAFQIIHQKLL